MLLLRRVAATALSRRALGRSRGLAGGHGPTGYGEGPYRGIEPHLPSFWHTAVARGMGCVMWLWVFYRFKVDGKAFLVRSARGPRAQCSATFGHRSRAPRCPAARASPPRQGIEGHYDHVDKDSLRAELLRWGKGLEYIDDEEKLDAVISAVASHHHHGHDEAHGEEEHE